MTQLPDIPIAFDRETLNIEVNESISIYQGEITLNSEYESVSIPIGEILLTWTPKPRIEFKGVANDSFRPGTSRIDVMINNKSIGTGTLYHSSFGSKITYKGIIHEHALNSKAVQNVSRVELSVVNLPFEVCDKAVRLDQSFWKGRYEFQIENAKIQIDARKDIKDIISELRSTGGYSITHHVKIVFDSPLSIGDSEILLASLRTSLRFLSGQDIGFVFLNFFHNDELIAEKFFYGLIKPYEYVHRVITMHSGLSNSIFFERVHNLLQDKTNYSALMDLIHWYNQSNANQGYAEGSLLLAQVGIELLYNWVIWEKLDMIDSPDANRISAVSKIKALVAFSGMLVETKSLPEELKVYCQSNNLSAPEAIVRLRNYLVHSNEKKRSSLADYDPIIFYQARNILLALIERYVLAIGQYESTFYNRLTNKLKDSLDWKLDL